MNNSSKLIELAQGIANTSPEFHKILGPGKGDKSTHKFMKELQLQAANSFGKDFSEQTMCGENNFAVDYYFPDDATIVEIALTIRNSNSEFHKDILKALLSKKAGNPVERLVFIAKPGAVKRHKEPASQAIIDLVREEFEIDIEIHELLDGENMVNGG